MPEPSTAAQLHLSDVDVTFQAIADAHGPGSTAVRRAVMLAGYPAPVAAAAMSGGAGALARIGLRVGRPLRPMLAGEVVALRADGRPESFQVTGARTAGRTDPGELRRTTPVTSQFFDVLHLDGVEELATETDGHVVTVRPEQVVEVAFDGVQRSRRYPAGMALRFARVVRYRDDKTAQEADTIDMVGSLAPAVRGKVAP